MNTAIVISQVKAALARAYLFGVTTKAKLPTYLTLNSNATKTSVT